MLNKICRPSLLIRVRFPRLRESAPPSGHNARDALGGARRICFDNDMSWAQRRARSCDLVPLTRNPDAFSSESDVSATYTLPGFRPGGEIHLLFAASKKKKIGNMTGPVISGILSSISRPD